MRIPTSNTQSLRKRGSRRRVLSAVLAAVALAAMGAQVPARAATGSNPTGHPAAKSAAATVQPVCSPAKKGQFTCFALRRTDVASAKGVLPSTVPAGYGPGDLASAYNLPSNGGPGGTVPPVHPPHAP